MQKRKLGRSDLEVSALGFGCMGLSFGFGPATEKNEAIKVIRAAYDGGVTFFDTAEAYGPFTNEELVGEALAPVRDKVVIATKFGFENGVPSQGTNSKPERIRAVAEAALKRLNTDVIDLFYQHRVDPNVPIEDVAGTVRDLIQEGRSNISVCRRLVQRTFIALMLCSRSRHSRVSIRCGGESRRFFQHWRNSVSDSSRSAPLGKGFLTLAISDKAEFDKTDFRNIVPRFSAEARKANQALVDALGRIADQKKATKAQSALAWLVAQKPWIVPIPGTTKLHRLEENLGGTDVELTPDDLKAIHDAVSAIAVHGDRYPAQLQSLVNR
jgi:aryl-alcohol dehydrogenase-like predicted oxidoreductase